MGAFLSKAGSNGNGGRQNKGGGLRKRSPPSWVIQARGQGVGINRCLTYILNLPTVLSNWVANVDNCSAFKLTWLLLLDILLAA
jgi:hypothetical protein